MRSIEPEGQKGKLKPSSSLGNVKLRSAGKASVQTSMVDRLHKLVVEAAAEIPLYTDLYGQNPRVDSLSDFRRLPIINKQSFARLEDVSKTVCNPWDMVGPFAP